MLKVVEFNGWANYENPEINIILLDKINRHEFVLEYLIQMQHNNIERSKPREFLSANLITENLRHVLDKKLISQYPGGIKLVTQSSSMARLVDKYHLEGHT